MRKMIFRSAEDWDTIMMDWANSGMGQNEFCRQIGVSYHTFARERVRRRKFGVDLPVPASKAKPQAKKAWTGDFVPVIVEMDPIKPIVEDVPEIVVELPMGVVIRIRGVQRS